MNKLHEWRDTQEMNQEQAAKALGISTGHLSMLEQGKRKPSLSLALYIQKKTGVDPSSFYGNTK